MSPNLHDERHENVYFILGSEAICDWTGHSIEVLKHILLTLAGKVQVIWHLELNLQAPFLPQENLYVYDERKHIIRYCL